MISDCLEGFLVPGDDIEDTNTLEIEAVRDAVLERPDDLAEAVRELSGIFIQEESVETTLQRIADLAIRVIPGCDGASVTLVENSKPQTTVWTDDNVLAVDEAQYDVGDGPCLDAIEHRRINLVSIGEARDEWPDFLRAAQQQGVRSFLAAPLLVRDTPIGALNLYSRDGMGFDALDEALIGLFTGQASVALSNARIYRNALMLAEQMREAMGSRAVIEQAKGILMAQEAVDADGAFEMLRRRSQHENRKLRVLAQEIVDSVKRE